MCVANHTLSLILRLFVAWRGRIGVGTNLARDVAAYPIDEQGLARISACSRFATQNIASIELCTALYVSSYNNFPMLLRRLRSLCVWLFAFCPPRLDDLSQ